MKTSTKTAAKALQDALSHQPYKVIALTGKWGTGKTHLWQTLNNKKKDILEISAFGAKNIDDIKRKLFQESVKVGSNGAKDFTASAINALEAIPKKFLGLSISDAALTALPLMVKGKVIIIDDIERKNKSLDISEILGLINEYTEKYKSRFLLILNTDSMEDKQLWQSLHEKVIDKEIVLNPSPTDSFEIAADGLDTPTSNIAKEVFVEHKVQNIRIIKKILQALQDILPKQNSLPKALLEYHIPTLVFLGICHYRGFSNGLTLDYVANHIFNQQSAPENEEWDKILKKSSLRLNKLSELAIDYLRYGVINPQDVSLYFEPLKRNFKNVEFHNKYKSFIETLYWNLEQTDADVYSFVESLAMNIYRLDSSQITNLYNDLHLHDYSDEAENSLSAWLEQAKIDPEIYSKLEYVYIERAPKRLWDFKSTLNPPKEKIVTLKEVIEGCLLKKQLTQKGINTLSNCTPADYEATLKYLTSGEIKDFIEFHFRLGENRDAYWQTAQESFIAAGKNIIKITPKTKLGKILRREFEQRKI